MIDKIVGIQEEFLESKSIESRKEFGQFFTDEMIAEYMASLIELEPCNLIRILDPGAGGGVLTAVSALRCLNLGILNVHAVLYEIDPEAVSVIDENLKSVTDVFRKKGGRFTYDVKCENFILGRPDQATDLELFDISIMNPPYFKYSVKTSPYAKRLIDLFKGDPNIYASFIAVAIGCLKSGGQLITISPRSFANGLYFKGFRCYLLSQAALNYIHIFGARNKLFNKKQSSVLQENIICKLTKSGEQGSIVVCSSESSVEINNRTKHVYSSSLIIDESNTDKMIRIPESKADGEILHMAESLEMTFEAAGYFISTGRTVEHRARDFIVTGNNSERSVPLLRPHNIKPPLVDWSGDNVKDAYILLKRGHEIHTVRNGNFVLLKRFSSKDEKRRLVASVHIGNKIHAEFIGFGNKMNYIGVNNEALTEIEATGLAAVFNSTFMDKYFRCISGNTQVNATEIRLMRFPTRKQVRDIGQEIMSIKAFGAEYVDKVVNAALSL